MCSFGNKNAYTELAGPTTFSSKAVPCYSDNRSLSIGNKFVGCHIERGGLLHHLKHGFPGYDFLSLLMKRQIQSL